MVFKTLCNENNERIFISPREIFEKNAIFTIDGIYIKRNVSTKYGTSDIAYVDITIDGEPYVMSVIQTVLFKAFERIHNGEFEDKANLDNIRFKISKPMDKTYYVLEYEIIPTSYIQHHDTTC